MALAVESIRQLRNDKAPLYIDILVKTSDVIYPGALVCVVAATGLLTPAADSTTLRFAGLAMGEGGDMKTVTGDGTKKCRVLYGNVEALLPCAATVDAGDVMTEVYCFDDGSVTDVNTLGPVAGLMTEVESSGVTCWVLIRGKAMSLGQ